MQMRLAGRKFITVSGILLGELFVTPSDLIRSDVDVLSLTPSFISHLSSTTTAPDHERKPNKTEKKAKFQVLIEQDFCVYTFGSISIIFSISPAQRGADK
jgi:hypothetical protein